jgi:hypothetical protein
LNAVDWNVVASSVPPDFAFAKIGRITPRGVYWLVPGADYQPHHLMAAANRDKSALRVAA